MRPTTATAQPDQPCVMRTSHSCHSASPSGHAVDSRHRHLLPLSPVTSYWAQGKSTVGGHVRGVGGPRCDHSTSHLLSCASSSLSSAPFYPPITSHHVTARSITAAPGCPFHHAACLL